MATDLVLDALDLAIWTRGRQGIHDLSGLIDHSDAGSPIHLHRLYPTPGRGRDCAQRRLACHDLTPAEYELIHYGQHPALTGAGVSTT